MKHKKPHITLFLIILIFLIVKVFQLFSQKGMLWDSAVYIGMGKYIFTLGKMGLWEPARPLILPLFLGFLWKMGFNPVISGRIVELVFSLGCVYITYLLGDEIFDEKIALLSALFLAFSPTFLFYSSSILTGIPSTFFALLAVYFFVKDRYFFTGFFAGLAFMARFLQLFILIPIFLVLCKKRLKNVISISLGFFVLIVPYLVVNMILYKNPVYPFMMQVFMTRYTGWVYHQPFSFYFTSLFLENFFVLFAAIGMLFILKQKKYEKNLILGIFLIFFITFSLIDHKETRLILVFLPYMYLVVSCGILGIFDFLKKNKGMAYLVVILLGSVWFIQTTAQIRTPAYNEYPEFRDYLKNGDVEKGIWISNPIFIVDSDKKPDELIYYPLYNSRRIADLTSRLSRANHVLIDTCDIIPCPSNDKNCDKMTGYFLGYMDDNLHKVHYKGKGSCEEFIFTSP